MSKLPETSAVFRDTLRDFTADRSLLILTAMAVVAGTGGAFSAWALLRLIALFTNIAYFGRLSVQPVGFAGAHLSPWTIGIPIIGSVIVGLMARYGSEKIRGHGIPEAIEAILLGQSRIEPKIALLKPLSSAIAIGTGGPFGAEGPIIMTGGALGSLFAQLFHLSAAERKTLLVAGAAAGMTGVFGTPIAAILLAVELLLFEWKPRSFIPVVTAAMVAVIWRPFLIGAGPLFAYTMIPALPWWGLAVCVLVGVIAGLQSALLTICLYGAEDVFHKLPIHWMWWPALGGVVVGIGGWINPAVLGVGYDNIHALVNGTLNMHESAALLIGKCVVWIAALSSGTSGGVLAPLLIMGGALGALEAHFLPFADVGFWAILGMAAILGGTMRAPLTATLFAVELTGNHDLLLPVLVAATAAFATTVLLMPRSILTERIARRGHHIMREYSIDPFLQTRVEQIMAKPAHTLAGSISIEQAIAFFMAAEGPKRHKSYPVVNADGKLVGIVSRADILRWSREGWDGNVNTLADAQRDAGIFAAYGDELVGHLADRMAVADLGRVPILERGTDRVVGVVARRDLLRVRARVIKEERERRRMLKFG